MKLHLDRVKRELARDEKLVWVGAPETRMGRAAVLACIGAALLLGGGFVFILMRPGRFSAARGWALFGIALAALALLFVPVIFQKVTGRKNISYAITNRRTFSVLFDAGGRKLVLLECPLCDIDAVNLQHRGRSLGNITLIPSPARRDRFGDPLQAPALLHIADVDGVYKLLSDLRADPDIRGMRIS